VIALCLESDDRVFHFRLYDWFLKRDLKEQLFRVSVCSHNTLTFSLFPVLSEFLFSRQLNVITHRRVIWWAQIKSKFLIPFLTSDAVPTHHRILCTLFHTWCISQQYVDDLREYYLRNDMYRPGTNFAYGSGLKKSSLKPCSTFACARCDFAHSGGAAGAPLVHQDVTREQGAWSVSFSPAFF
jgi:hypothetical protein